MGPFKKLIFMGADLLMASLRRFLFFRFLILCSDCSMAVSNAFLVNSKQNMLLSNPNDPSSSLTPSGLIRTRALPMNNGQDES